MMAATNKPGEWVEWNGGECPVEPGTMVEVRFRPFHYNPSPAEFATLILDKPEEKRWGHNGFAGDFIAYRVVQP
jgi:hypothetical protein